MPLIFKVDERGKDLIINDVVSIPKDKVTIIKHTDFVQLQFDQKFFDTSTGRVIDYAEVRYQTCTDPSTANNDELFDELYKLKD